ncbi:MAG: PHP domain-containing protein, partial [Gemmataceae bacterium]
MPALLHVHSWYSLLDGTAGLPALLRAAREGGHDALALTDTNNLYGAVPFARLAAREGVRPLFGACLERGGRRAVALVADPAGYRNLCHAITACDPRGPDGTLESAVRDLQSTDGLHLLTADAGLAAALKDRFPGRLWLEVVRPGDPRREAELLDAAGRLGLPAVASTAAHLARADEYDAHRLVTAVRRLTLIDRLPPRLPVTAEHRVASVDEMRRRFRDLPQALRNADLLAADLRSDVLPRRLVLPAPVRSRPLNLTEYLRALCERGLRERGLAGDRKALERLRRELHIIENNELPGYFLTVRDIARFARDRGHTMALRGSAGNSLVCYLLGITDVDPLRFRLELERFLHPGRVDLPDIDLDFDWKVRDEVIDHVVRRYGQAHVARISAHQFMQPRSAF